MEQKNKINYLINDGNKYYEEKKYKSALICYDKYLELCKDEKIERNDSYFMKLSCVLYNAGTTLIKLDMHEQAIYYFKQSIFIYESIYNIINPDDSKLGNNYFNIGFCYIKLHNEYMAYKYFKSSIEYLPNEIKYIKKVLKSLKDNILL